jgi:hypothetical protein
MAVDEEVEGVAGEEAEGVAGEVDPSVVVANSQEILATLPRLSSGMTTMCLTTKPHISKLVEGEGVGVAVVVDVDGDEDLVLLGLGSQLSLEPDQFQRQTYWDPLAC